MLAGNIINPTFLYNPAQVPLLFQCLLNQFAPQRLPQNPLKLPHSKQVIPVWLPPGVQTAIERVIQGCIGDPLILKGTDHRQCSWVIWGSVVIWSNISSNFIFSLIFNFLQISNHSNVSNQFENSRSSDNKQHFLLFFGGGGWLIHLNTLIHHSCKWFKMNKGSDVHY